MNIDVKAFSENLIFVYANRSHIKNKDLQHPKYLLNINYIPVLRWVLTTSQKKIIIINKRKSKKMNYLPCTREIEEGT